MLEVLPVTYAVRGRALLPRSPSLRRSKNSGVGFETAGGEGNKYHNYCDCIPVPVVGRWVVDPPLNAATVGRDSPPVMTSRSYTPRNTSRIGVKTTLFTMFWRVAARPKPPRVTRRNARLVRLMLMGRCNARNGIPIGITRRTWPSSVASR